MSSPKSPRYMNFERKSCYNDPIRGYFMNKFKAKSVSWWKIVVLSSFTHCKLSMCIFVIIPLLSTILCYLPLRFCFFQASIQLYGSKPRKIIHCQRSEYFVFIWGGGGSFLHSLVIWRQFWCRQLLIFTSSRKSHRIYYRRNLYRDWLRELNMKAFIK